MPFVNLDGLRFHYQQWGQGSDVIMVHPVTGNLTLWLLLDVIDPVAADFRLTCYDLRGHGYTDTPATGYTSADMADDLFKLHQEIGLGPAVLVGHSWGAVIAMHAAVRHPGIVRGLILSDPYFPALHHLEPDLAQTNAWATLKEYIAKTGAEVSDEECGDMEALFRRVAAMSDEEVKKAQQALGNPLGQWLVPVRRLGPTTIGRDMKEVAGLTEANMLAVQQPTALLYGADSPFLAQMRHLERNMPHCRSRILEGSDHLAPLRNRSEFAEALLPFLRVFKTSQAALGVGER